MFNTDTGKNQGSKKVVNSYGIVSNAENVAKSDIKIEIQEEDPVQRGGSVRKMTKNVVDMNPLANERKPKESRSQTKFKSPKKSSKCKKRSQGDKGTRTVMKASVNKIGSVSCEAVEERRIEKKNIIGRKETNEVNLNAPKLVKEEKTSLGKVRETVERKALTKVQLAMSRENFQRSDLAINDMVVIKVADTHFIPGQPCLGRVTSLPDTVGVVLVHYYSGSYEGDWKPMMSRSSPYLRRVPISNIVHKFELDEAGRMSVETIKKIKDVIENAKDC